VTFHCPRPLISEFRFAQLGFRKGACPQVHRTEQGGRLDCRNGCWWWEREFLCFFSAAIHTWTQLFFFGTPKPRALTPDEATSSSNGPGGAIFVGGRSRDDWEITHEAETIVCPAREVLRPFHQGQGPLPLGMKNHSGRPVTAGPGIWFFPPTPQHSQGWLKQRNLPARNATAMAYRVLEWGCRKIRLENQAELLAPLRYEEQKRSI